MNISGATSSSYALQSSDVGDTIDIVVTATNAGGSGSATSSKTQTVKPPPPANTGAPTISGTAQQGQTLTASNGSWSNSPTSYGHQWQDCSSSCSNISGATGSTYNLQSSDVGDTIDVVVTATNAGGSGSATSAKTATVTAATAPPPANTGAPTISGTAQQGQTLTASNGSWSNSPTSYGHQWQDCSSSCSNISGATGSTYNLQSSDVGDTIDVVVTATNAGGSGSATSAKTATVTASSSPPSAPSNTSAPVVTGTAQQGNTLTASSGTWTGTAPIDYTYQWQDCSSGACTNISGATSTTYVLQSSDVGNTIDVVVTGTNGAGSASATSAQTASVSSSSGMYALPADRTFGWNPGLNAVGGIPNRTSIYETISPSGGDDTATIQAALNSCPVDGVVQLTAGVFNISGHGLSDGELVLHAAGCRSGSGHLAGGYGTVGWDDLGYVFGEGDQGSGYPVAIIGPRWGTARHGCQSDRRCGPGDEHGDGREHVRAGGWRYWWPWMR